MEIVVDMRRRLDCPYISDSVFAIDIWEIKINSNEKYL